MELKDSVNICDGEMMNAVTLMCPNLIDVIFVQHAVGDGVVPITSQELQMILKDKLPKV